MKVSTIVHLMPVLPGLFNSGSILEVICLVSGGHDPPHNVTSLTEVVLARHEKPADWDLIATTFSCCHCTAHRNCHLQVTRTFYVA